MAGASGGIAASVCGESHNRTSTPEDLCPLVWRLPHLMIGHLSQIGLLTPSSETLQYHSAAHHRRAPPMGTLESFHSILTPGARPGHQGCDPPARQVPRSPEHKLTRPAGRLHYNRAILNSPLKTFRGPFLPHTVSRPVSIQDRGLTPVAKAAELHDPHLILRME